MNLNKFKEFLERQSWIYSKRYANTAPHFYIRKNELSDNDKLIFEDFAKYIRSNGYVKKFWKRNFTYFELDGYTYWTYGDPIPITIILNRIPIKEISE